jgi:hypothetical protein
MISIIQSGSPLGVVFGYLLTAYIKTNFIVSLINFFIVELKIILLKIYMNFFLTKLIKYYKLIFY